MDDPDITPLLERAAGGDRAALDDVARHVYNDLTRLAGRMVRRRFDAGAHGIALDPASLVQETFVRLLAQRNQYRNREHFFAVATRVMLRVLLDHHKALKRRKRGGELIRITLSSLGRVGAVEPATEVPRLVEALERLGALDARVAQVVKLRGLWGLGAQETADVMGVSRSTVDRDWKFGRTWLRANL